MAAEDIYRTASAQGLVDYFPVLAGQGLHLLKGGQGAAEIVAELIVEAKANLSRLAGLTD